MAVRLSMVDSQNKNIGLFVVSAYAPIGTAAEVEWNNFFDELDICTSKKLPNDILIIGSDTNSSMGYFNRNEDDTSFCMGRFGLPQVNHAGKRFVSHLAINELLAVTTCFRKNEYATWIHPRSKLKHQIDQREIISVLKFYKTIMISPHRRVCTQSYRMLSQPYLIVPYLKGKSHHQGGSVMQKINCYL